MPKNNIHIIILALLAGIWLSFSADGHGIQPVRIGAQSSIVEVSTVIDEDNGYLGGGSGISLREAVMYSGEGSIIVLAAKTYTLDRLSVSTLTIDRDITINGAGAANTTITGGAGSVLCVRPGIAATIADLMIESGNASKGGALRNYGNAALYSVTLAGNRAVDGGAIYNTGNLELRGVILSGNKAAMYGGGIFNDGGTITATNAALLQNSSVKGGGLYNQFGVCRISFGTILGNTSGSGGGIADYIGIVELQNTSAADNFGGNYSGRILTLGGNFDSDGSGSFTAAADVTSKSHELASEYRQSNRAPTSRFAVK